MRLDALPSSLYRTLVLIFRYVYRENRSSRCFTYQGLRSWIHYVLPRHERPEWHTVERAIRRLAEMGVLARRHIRKHKVVFCPGELWYELLAQYRQRLREAPSLSQPYRELLEYLEAEAAG